MLVNYLLLDANNVCIEAPVFDTEVNNGEVPDFIHNRAGVANVITTYRGEVYIGGTWDGSTLSNPNPPPPPEKPNDGPKFV